MNYINLPESNEEEIRSRDNQEVNKLIKAKFKQSIMDESAVIELRRDSKVEVPAMLNFKFVCRLWGDIGSIRYGYNAYSVDRMIYKGINDFEPKTSRDMGKDITTLREHDYAVICFHQGLMFRGKNIDIETLTEAISIGGYYWPQKGTSPNLFDHYGLRRATSWLDIRDALENGHLVTCLTEKLIESNDGPKYVNLVGGEKNNDMSIILVEIPMESEHLLPYLKYPMENMIQSIEIAWIW